MKTLAFLSQKGGSGKTTLAVHTAVAAQEAGERVVVVDTDRQQSAAVWGKTRQRSAPIILPASPAELHDVVNAARHDAMTLCIVDTAPHATPDAARIASLVDLVVIPCRPSAFDLAAASSAVEIVRAAGVAAVLVLSAAPFRAPETKEARAALVGFGLPVAPVAITDRRAFARAIASGTAVTEFESDGKAAEEIRAFWRWLKEQAAHDDQTHRSSRVLEPLRFARAG
jgi:chromosome partitioning protein